MSNHFCFIAPMFNASETLSQMIMSLVSQTYDNWSLTLIDDVSDEDHREKCEHTIAAYKGCLKLLGGDPNKIKVIWNHLSRGKQWETSNVLYGISLCEEDDIVCRIDADDRLCDPDALTLLDFVYTRENVDLAWTMHRWGYSDRNISGHMSDDSDPYVHPWVASHLKTFRKRLITNVPYENFTNASGQLVKRAGDQAIYLPCLHNAKKWFFVPRVMYHYTIDEQDGAIYQTDDAKFQKQEADFIRARGYVKEGTPWEEIFK